MLLTILNGVDMKKIIKLIIVNALFFGLLLSFVACDEEEAFFVEVAVGSRRPFVAVQSDGGLGNRLRTLASAYVLAQRTGRDLYLAWEKKENNMILEPEDLFQFPDSVERVGGPLVLKAKKITISPTLKQNTRDAWQYLLDQTESNLYLHSFHRLVPVEDDFELLRLYVDFYQKLEPSVLVREKVNNYKRSVNFDESLTVGVHVRTFQKSTGDTIGVGDKFSPQPYVNAMRAELSLNSDFKFFVATDDLSVLGELKALFPDKIMHYPTPKIDRDSFEGQINGAVDWFLLGDTQKIIGRYGSSFSDEAAYRTEAGFKIDVGSCVFDYCKESESPYIQ